MTPEPSRRRQFLAELAEQVSTPVHRRLIEAYGGGDPVQSMETELGKILLEVIAREDEEPDRSGVPGLQ